MQRALTRAFSNFLRRRRVKRHFERRPLLDTPVAAPSVSPAAGVVSSGTRELSQVLLLAAHDEPDAGLEHLQSQVDGLYTAEAARRLVRDGPNEIAHEAHLPGWLHLRRCCLNPFNLTSRGVAGFISPFASP